MKALVVLAVLLPGLPSLAREDQPKICGRAPSGVYHVDWKEELQDIVFGVRHNRKAQASGDASINLRLARRFSDLSTWHLLDERKFWPKLTEDPPKTCTGNSAFSEYHEISVPTGCLRFPKEFCLAEISQNGFYSKPDERCKLAFKPLPPPESLAGVRCHAEEALMQWVVSVEYELPRDQCARRPSGCIEQRAGVLDFRSCGPRIVTVAPEWVGGDVDVTVKFYRAQLKPIDGTMTLESQGKLGDDRSSRLAFVHFDLPNDISWVRQMSSPEILVTQDPNDIEELRLVRADNKDQWKVVPSKGYRDRTDCLGEFLCHLPEKSDDGPGGSAYVGGGALFDRDGRFVAVDLGQIGGRRRAYWAAQIGEECTKGSNRESARARR